MLDGNDSTQSTQKLSRRDANEFAATASAVVAIRIDRAVVANGAYAHVDDLRCHWRQVPTRPPSVTAKTGRFAGDPFWIPDNGDPMIPVSMKSAEPVELFFENFRIALAETVELPRIVTAT